MAAQTSQPRRIPQRTCITCRRVASKRGFVRLVRTANNGVMIDPSGKAAGRGAYLCAARQCWEAAFKRGAINRALRILMSNSDQAVLNEYAQQLDADDRAQEFAMN